MKILAFLLSLTFINLSFAQTFSEADMQISYEDLKHIQLKEVTFLRNYGENSKNNVFVAKDFYASENKSLKKFFKKYNVNNFCRLDSEVEALKKYKVYALSITGGKISNASRSIHDRFLGKMRGYKLEITLYDPDKRKPFSVKALINLDCHFLNGTLVQKSLSPYFMYDRFDQNVMLKPWKRAINHISYGGGELNNQKIKKKFLKTLNEIIYPEVVKAFSNNIKLNAIIKYHKVISKKLNKEI